MYNRLHCPFIYNIQNKYGNKYITIYGKYQLGGEVMPVSTMIISPGGNYQSHHKGQQYVRNYNMPYETGTD